MIKTCSHQCSDRSLYIHARLDRKTMCLSHPLMLYIHARFDRKTMCLSHPLMQYQLTLLSPYTGGSLNGPVQPVCELQRNCLCWSFFNINFGFNFCYKVVYPADHCFIFFRLFRCSKTFLNNRIQKKAKHTVCSSKGWLNASTAQLLKILLRNVFENLKLFENLSYDLRDTLLHNKNLKPKLMLTNCQHKQSL